MYVYMYIHTYIHMALSHLLPCPKPALFPHSQLTFPHSGHVCRATQQTCLLWTTADMSAVSNCSHVWCVTKQTGLLCDTADMSAV